MIIEDNKYFKTTMTQRNGLITITQIDKIPNETSKIVLGPDEVRTLEKTLRNMLL